MIIAIGFRVRSSTGTKFRIWAKDKLKEYITKGFVLNDERFKNGSSMNYFDELQKRLRDIRISEKFLGLDYFTPPSSTSQPSSHLSTPLALQNRKQNLLLLKHLKWRKISWLGCRGVLLLLYL